MGEISKRKDYAVRKVVLCVQHRGQFSPWSLVEYAKAVEILGVELNSAWRIEVRDGAGLEPDFDYFHKGPGLKLLNVPRGEIRLVRLKGQEPVTAYAHCGP